MIHHVWIPARDPKHVAGVLGELLGGYVGPFVGPIPGAWVAYADDEHGRVSRFTQNARCWRPERATMSRAGSCSSKLQLRLPFMP